MDQTLTSLDKSLSTLIEGATEKGAKLVDFLYSQAPDVINQLLLYHGVESVIEFILGLLLVIVWPFILCKIIKKYHKWFDGAIEDAEEHPGFIVPSILFALITMVITQISGWNLMNLIWLKIWIAPKVYLLEWLSSLTK